MARLTAEANQTGPGLGRRLPTCSSDTLYTRSVPLAFPVSHFWAPFRRLLWAMGAAWAAAAATAQPDAGVAPFSGGAPPPDAYAGAVWEAGAAERALAAGFYSIAEGLFREGLANPSISGPRREELRLSLVSALLGQRKYAAASAELDRYIGPTNAEFQLRRAAVAFAERQWSELGERLLATRAIELSAADRGWHAFFQAMLLDQQGERERAQRAFEQALAFAVSAAQRAQFQLGQFQTRLQAGQASELLAEQIRRQADELQGRRVGYQFGQQYAVVLDQLGRKPEAVAYLQRQLQILPVEESDLRDQMLLLLGLLAGAESAVGRDALRQLVVSGSRREMQRQALQELSSSAAGPALAQLLDDTIARNETHPLLEELLHSRAQLALGRRQWDRAEADARMLLARFPGSQLRGSALAILASVAWQQQRYRAAADFLGQLRAALPPGPERAELAALMADSHFRAGVQGGAAEDYRNAADAYAAAAAENPPGVPAGLLLYQQILAEIRAGRPDRAREVLDASSDEAGPARLFRWQAEWNLAKTLQQSGQTEEAFSRVARLAALETLPSELRLRFLWLQARLSMIAGRPADTPGQVESVLAFAAAAEPEAVPPSLRDRVASSARLLRAEAFFAMGDAAAGRAAVEQLRETYPGSAAAVFSLIAEARFLAARGGTVEAQQLLVRLADAHPESEYAPLALYEAALNAERRGQESFLQEATALLERLAKDYPQDSLLFFARLRQADLLRRMNQFGAAQQIYEFLQNTFPDSPHRPLAELSLADALLAQAEADPAKFTRGVAKLERLFDLPSATPELRAEAGCKLALALQSRGELVRAKQVHWTVRDRFLASREAPALGATGRYWLSRSLLELAQLEEREQSFDLASDLYEEVTRGGLPGGALAEARLSRLRPRAALP
jgi:cellulose synthase operon protein C